MSSTVFKNLLVEVVREGDKVKAFFPYAPVVFNKLKKYAGAKFDHGEKCWMVDAQHEEYVKKLLQKYYDKGEQKIILAPNIISVNGAPAVRYGRDSAEMRELGFQKRMGNHGSRKNPVYEGVVAVVATVNENTVIQPGEHKIYSYSPENLERLEEKVKEIANRVVYMNGKEPKPYKVYGKVVREIEEEFKADTGGPEEEPGPSDSEESQVDSEFLKKGAVVRSTLPSRAVLDRRLPEIFKDRQVGDRHIAQVTGYFRNKLPHLSTRFYKKLKETCVEVPVGTNAKMYVVPPNEVPGFYEWVKGFRKEYEEYERQLRDFIKRGKVPHGVRKDANFDPDYFDVVGEYLRKNGLKDEIKVPEIADRVDIHFEHFHMGDTLFQMFAEEKLEDLQESLSEKERRALQDLEKEVEQSRQKMMKDAQESVRKKVKETMKQIDDLAREVEETSRKPAMNRVRRLRNALNAAESLAQSTGLEANFGEARAVLDAAEESSDYKDLQSRINTQREKNNTDQALAEAVAGFASE